MKNRKLILILSLVLALTMSLGGTLAYLTDTDSDVNTMVLGNVKIEQHEYQRKDVNGDGQFDSNDTTTITEGEKAHTSYVLEGFEQNKPLLPIVGDPNEGEAGWDDTIVRMSQVGSYGGMKPFAGKNAVDKFVTVENTGNSDAYVRTYVAFEIGSTDGSLIRQSYHDGAWNRTDFDNDQNNEDTPLYVTINGNNYKVYEYVYVGADLGDGSWRHANGILPAGDTTYPSLAQVFIKSKANNADLEAIDGNQNGKLDILVLSQAVQADGFDNAVTALNASFGAADADKVVEWFMGLDDVKDQPVVKMVKDATELKDAIEAGAQETIVLANDVTLTAGETLNVADGASVTLNLAGHTLAGSSVETGKNRNLFTVKGELTVVGGSVIMEHTGDNMGWSNLVAAFSVEGGVLTLDDVTVKNKGGSDMAFGVDVNTTLGETVLNIEGYTTITSTYTGVRIFNNHKTATGTVNLIEGTVKGTSRDIWAQKASADSNMDNAIVKISNGATYDVINQESGGKIYQIR